MLCIFERLLEQQLSSQMVQLVSPFSRPLKNESAPLLVQVGISDLALDLFFVIIVQVLSVILAGDFDFEKVRQ